MPRSPAISQASVKRAHHSSPTHTRSWVRGPKVGPAGARLITTRLWTPPSANRRSCQARRSRVTFAPDHHHSGVGPKSRGGLSNNCCRAGGITDRSFRRRPGHSHGSKTFYVSLTVG